MATALQSARRFEELVGIDGDGSYLFDRIFSEEGWRARRRSRKVFKLLKKIDEPLRAMLRKGEQVFFVTYGIASLSAVEMFFIGGALRYTNRRAIVLTNRRILLLQIDSWHRPRELRSQIRGECIARFRSTALGNTKITFHNGRSVLFTNVPRADRKWLVSTMNETLQRLETTDQRGIEPLCPHCCEPVDGRPPACPHCTAPFKSAKTAGLLSLVFPGAGDLYLGHHVFAAVEAFVGLVLWVGLVVVARDPTVGLAEALAVGLVVVLLIDGLDALKSLHLGTKGLALERGRSNRWRFAAAAAIPAISLAVILAGVPAKRALRPEPAVVAGEQLPPRQLAALRNAGYVTPGETVRYFYSDGPATVLQDGNLFTDDRIVSYAIVGDTTMQESAGFDEVVDLEFVPAQQEGAASTVLVVKDDGGFFQLILSPLGGGDSLFADALFDRWRTVRAAMPEGGIWFDGGAGSSAADAIVVRGLQNRQSGEAIEDWWLRVWFGEPGSDWSLIDRRELTEGDRVFDVVTLDPVGEEQVQVYFDVTGDT